MRACHSLCQGTNPLSRDNVHSLLVHVCCVRACVRLRACALCVVCVCVCAGGSETGSGGPNPFLPMEDAHPMFPTLVDMRKALKVSSEHTSVRKHSSGIAEHEDPVHQSTRAVLRLGAIVLSVYR